MDWLMLVLIINVVCYSIVAICAGVIWYNTLKIQRGWKDDKK